MVSTVKTPLPARLVQTAGTMGSLQNNISWVLEGHICPQHWAIVCYTTSLYQLEITYCLKDFWYKGLRIMWGQILWHFQAILSGSFETQEVNHRQLLGDWFFCSICHSLGTIVFFDFTDIWGFGLAVLLKEGCESFKNLPEYFHKTETHKIILSKSKIWWLTLLIITFTCDLLVYISTDGFVVMNCWSHK